MIGAIKKGTKDETRFDDDRFGRNDSRRLGVVLNDGTLDTGNIAPGAFSAPMMLRAVGPYHCSIHPSMVGTIVSGQ